MKKRFNDADEAVKKKILLTLKSQAYLAGVLHDWAVDNGCKIGDEGVKITNEVAHAVFAVITKEDPRLMPFRVNYFLQGLGWSVPKDINDKVEEVEELEKDLKSHLDYWCNPNGWLADHEDAEFYEDGSMWQWVADHKDEF